MIRKASPNDAEGVEAITQMLWDQKIDFGMFRDHVANKACSLCVAVEDDQVVGFVSSFLTVDVQNRRRWEVDLLAVRPDQQGKGLGTALIQSIGCDAKAHRVDVVRALVRTDNIASQKAFERAGYTSDGCIHHLYLWMPQMYSGEIVVPQQVTLSPLDTLTYRGLGIEGLMSASLSEEERRRIILAARHRVASEGRNNTGALIPVDEEGLLPLQVREQGEIQGAYCWWIK